MQINGVELQLGPQCVLLSVGNCDPAIFRVRIILRIVWDEPKRLSNIERRGLDFAVLDIEFFADAVVTPAKLGRFRAVGLFGGNELAVIFKPLGTEAISVISMRPASRKERSML